MTEADWCAGADPRAMLAHITDLARLRSLPRYARRLRLFACACARTPSVWDRLDDPRLVASVEAGERYADGPLGDYCGGGDVAHGDTGLEAVQRAAHGCWWGRRDPGPGEAAAGVASQCSVLNAECAAEWLCRHSHQEDSPRISRHGLADLLREVFGNPFLVTPAPPGGWRTPLVLAMARTIYADRAWGDLPILADALEEAGLVQGAVVMACARCGRSANVGINHRASGREPWMDCDNCQVTLPAAGNVRPRRLERPHRLVRHLRGPGPHARGCWALDVVLGHTAAGGGERG